MSKRTSLVLAQHDVTEIVNRIGLETVMDQLIDRLREAFTHFDAERTQIPVRSGFSYAKPMPGLLEWMPLLQHGDQMLMKMVGYHPQNPAIANLPTILSSFSLYDATTGHLRAIMDGTLMTALRTGAASAVATSIMASQDNVSEVGLIGCGAQAVTQLHALTRCFDVRAVRYFDTDSSAMDSYAARVALFAEGIDLIPNDVQTMLPEIDVLCLATSVPIGGGPVFQDDQVRPHLHINAVGSDFPGKTEVPKSILDRSYVSPDCLAQAVDEGECQQLDAGSIGDEISHLCQRDDLDALQQSLTVFDSTGWALEDFESAKLFMEWAEELGVGTTMELEAHPVDPRHPYESLRTPRSTVGDAALNAAASGPS